jgi:glycosyltransferase involved in cell wall biosynthesis
MDPTTSVIMLFGSRYEDLASICGSLRCVLAPLAPGYEVILVDEATGPDTQARIRALRQQFPEVRVIRLRRHMGESTALAAGIQSARGEILITLDPYLHVSLEELPKLLEPLRNGTDLVCAWRFPRREGAVSRAASAAFNGVARWLTNVPVHDLNCRTRVMRREVFDALPLYGDLHRFIPIFASRRGYRWCEVQVAQQPGKRELGAFDLRSYIGRFLDLVTLAFLTRFLKRPLHFFGLVGLMSFSAGFVISALLAYQKLALGRAVGHRPLLLLGILLIVVGVQIASIGLLGELMIFTHARDLKDYVIEEERGGGDA